MNEIDKYEAQKKRMQSLCDEHGLVYKFSKNKYPITLTIMPCKDMDSQIDMLEAAEEEGYRSPDASMKLIYPGRDDSQCEAVFDGGKFTISETLRGKIQGTFMKMCFYWQQYFFRDVIARGLLNSGTMPEIDEDDAEDIEPDDAPEEEGELPSDLEPLEDEDPIVGEAAQLVRTENKVSIALLQRRLNVGFTKAKAIMEKLYDLGVIGDHNEVLPYDVPEDGNKEDADNG